MAWYRVGAVNVTNGSKNVVGVGTDWLSLMGTAQVSNSFVGPDGRLYEVALVLGAGSLQLVEHYLGATAATQAYAIMPTMGLTAELARQVGLLIQQGTAGLAIKGVKSTYEELPAVSDSAVGDAWVVGSGGEGRLYVQTGAEWYDLGAIGVSPELQAARDQAVAAKDVAVESAAEINDRVYPGVQLEPPLHKPISGDPCEEGDSCFILTAGSPRRYAYVDGNWTIEIVDGLLLSQPDATQRIGYVPGYPGAGWEAGDLQRVLDERVSVRSLGVASTQSPSVNTTKFQTAIERAAANRFALQLPFEDLAFSGPCFLDHTLIANQAGVSIIGQATRTTKILYTGPDYWLSITGQGREGDTPITQFDLRNFRVSAGNNALSKGALYIDRVNRVKLFGFSADSFFNPAAWILEIRNFFNLEIEKFNISGGASLPQGQYGLVFGSKNSAPGANDCWNSSNLKVRNGLIQRMAGKGAVCIHDDNIIDNVDFEHVSFGANSQGSLSVVSDKCHNLSLKNIHLESCGTQPDGSFVPAKHIYVDMVSGVDIKNCESKDASTHVHLHRCKGFSVSAMTLFESGEYSILGSVGIDITGEAANTSSGEVHANNIYTTQIDTPYRADAFSSVDVGNRQVTEAQWSSVYAPQPGYYGKGTIVRRDLFPDHTDRVYDLEWTAPDGLTFLRRMLSSRHVGWGTTFPTVGAYTRGDIVFNEAPSVSGVTPYTTLGWRRLTTGATHEANTDWVALRCLTGAPVFTSAWDGVEPLKLGGFLHFHNGDGQPAYKSGAPTGASDGIRFGTKVVIPSSSGSAGVEGQWAADTSFIYIYQTGAWRRAAIGTW